MAKIVFTGGGTAGHVFPITAIIREMKKLKPGSSSAMQVYYVGPKDDYSCQALSKEGALFKFIIAGKLRRYFDLKNVLDFFKIPIGFFQSLWFLFWLAPDLIFSTGGYGSITVCLAGKLLGIPIFLHESDSIPGLASKIESKWAKEIFTSFPKTKNLPPNKVLNVGNPVRASLFSGQKAEGQRIFNIVGGRPLLLVLGGSQGSQSINNLIIDILPELIGDFEIVHQTGRRNLKEVKLQTDFVIEERRLKPFYHLIDFIEEDSLRHILAACDLVVSRAGASTLFEIAALSKPAILIPLTGSAQGHQLENAYQFAEVGGGEVIAEENLTTHFFLEKIRFLLSRPGLLQEMGRNAHSFAKLKAAEIIANYLIDYLYQTLST
jgi:UDP-N-acetylglucosamine--N-acetylmuramyl-(pentapeptide) pyrophosphoryl-undecaprenol N-acetylglucosamine transferase